jgi:hypothetical protein
MNQEKSKNCDVDKLSSISEESNNASFSYDNMSIINSLLDSEGNNLSIKDDDNNSINNTKNEKNQIYYNAYLYLQQFNCNNQILCLINEINRYKLLQMIINEQSKNNFINGVYLNRNFRNKKNNKKRGNTINIKKNLTKPENEINISNIISGTEKRCCVKLSPIPNNYSPFDIIRLIDRYLKTEKGKRIYNSIYVPLTKEIGKNKGYCFVNMVSPKYVVTFYEVFNGLFFNLKKCKKPCYLVFSDIQNVNFSNEDALKRPIIFTDVIKN